MTMLQDVLTGISQGLVALMPYFHVDEEPWNKPYREMKTGSDNGSFQEFGFRNYSLHVNGVESVPVGGLSRRRYLATVHVRVLYSFGPSRTKPQEYFVEEVDKMRKLAEAPALWAIGGLRNIQYVSSQIESAGKQRRAFVHEYEILVDETDL